jgi:hypothetical protein
VIQRFNPLASAAYFLASSYERWLNPASSAGWSVKDMATHLLDTDIFKDVSPECTQIHCLIASQPLEY